MCPNTKVLVSLHGFLPWYFFFVISRVPRVASVLFLSANFMVHVSLPCKSMQKLNTSITLQYNFWLCFKRISTEYFIGYIHTNRMPILSGSVITSGIKELPALPVSWFVKRVKEQALYVLNLRACEIRDISEQVAPQFSLSSAGIKPGQKDRKSSTGSSHVESVLSYPELILKVDLSLNNIWMLKVEDLIIFPELRSLDVSLNAIRYFEGIQAASKLVFLNLSYNNISELPNEALAECINLQTLDLSANKISSLAGFPSLPNLTKLYLRRNKLKNLQGIQVLRSIKQLDVSKNSLTTIIHVCPCLELTELNTAENNLESLPDFVSALSPLLRLKQITIKGNPLYSATSPADLQSVFMRETAIVLLDGVNIRPAKVQFKGFSHHQPPSPRDDLKLELKKAVRESMKEGTERKRKKIQDSIGYLHKKILTLLEELEEHEDLSVADTEAWCKYIDTLTLEEAQSLTVSQIRAAAIAEPDGYLPVQVSGSVPTHSRTRPTKPKV